MFRTKKLKRWDDNCYMITGDYKVRSKFVLPFFQSTIVLMVILLAVPAHAEVILGAKIGHMKIDLPSSADPTNIAVNVGYEFDSLLADLCLVGEINRTISSGETSQGDELKFDSNGVFLAWKTTRSIFVTLRGGFVQNEIITGSNSRKDDGLLVGGGIGLVIGKTRLHIEYTSLAGDANFLSVGLDF